MYMAYMQSESYSWVAFGMTETGAKQALVNEWNSFFGCEDGQETIESIEKEYKVYINKVCERMCFVFDR